jgi:DNA-binding transcriptional ArsR family regulator
MQVYTCMSRRIRPRGVDVGSQHAFDGICLISYIESVNAFAVLAEPTRRRILDALLDGERPVSDLVERLGMSQPAVSKHLRVLREAGMVVARIDAQRRCYRLEPAALAEVDAWLAPYRKLWAERLDALEAHLDRRDQT